MNQVQTLYNGFGQPVSEYQSHGGTVNTSTTPRTQYGYASGAANTIRPTSLTYPSGRTLTYNYGTAGTLSDQASRVASIVDSDTTTLVSYEYLGRGSFVRAASPQPTLAWTLVSLTGTNDPDTGDIYTGLDRFGRVKDNRWLNTTTSTDVDRIQYGYDRASNRLWRHNVVATSNGQAFDELYTYDGVQRLKDMSRGTLNGTKTALTSSTFGQCWTLDSTGNWTGFREDDTGNGTWDLVQSRTANPVNEITAITNTTGPAWATPAYDPNGNMTKIPRGGTAGSKNWSGLSLDDWSGLSTDDWSEMTVNSATGPTAFSATYDAWNRLITLTDPESAAVLQRNTYDARRFRIKREDLGQAPRHFYYTPGWQCLEERASTTPDSSTPDRQFVWGLRYIDDLILRDRDTDSNGSLNERLYACQDGNWNVTALVSSTGSVVERYAYSAYGEPVFLTPAFTSRDGSIFNVEHLYCDYRWDDSAGLYHIRHRSYSPLVGTWHQRDPKGMVDSHNLTIYCAMNPINYRDTFGEAIAPPPPFQGDDATLSWFFGGVGRGIGQKCCFLCYGPIAKSTERAIQNIGLNDRDDLEGGNAMLHCMIACSIHASCSKCDNNWDRREPGGNLGDRQDLANNRAGRGAMGTDCFDGCRDLWKQGRLTCQNKGRTMLVPCPPPSKDYRNPYPPLPDPSLPEYPWPMA